jgi:hypothetical protein
MRFSVLDHFHKAVSVGSRGAAFLNGKLRQACLGGHTFCETVYLLSVTSSQASRCRDMRSLKLWIVLLAVMTVAVVRAAEPVVLPTVSSDTLSKQHLTLPADLHTDRNLLLLYFDLTQQPDVDSWNSVIDRWRANDPSLTAYTSLVSSQKNFLSRWWQNASMRSAAPDSSRWPTTLPLYVDKHAFERRLQISSEKGVVLLLLDRKGHVLSRVSGPPNDSSRNAMRAALNAAGSPVAPAPANAPSH